MSIIAPPSARPRASWRSPWAGRLRRSRSSRTVSCAKAGTQKVASSAAAASFDAHGSVEQVYATGLPANASTSLLDSSDNVVATRDANDLGVAHHRIIPEFLKARTPDDTIDRGLGIFRLRGFAYRATLTGVDRVVHEADGATVVEYHNTILDRYFMTSDAHEQSLLDSGTLLQPVNARAASRISVSV